MTFKICALLLCMTFVHGGILVQHPDIEGIINPVSIYPDLGFLPGQVGAGNQLDGIWSQFGAQELYMNQAGMGTIYQDYAPLPAEVHVSASFNPLFQGQNQYVPQYEGGYHGSFMRPAMSFYPTGHNHMGGRFCLFDGGFPSMMPLPLPAFPQMQPTFSQPQPTFPQQQPINTVQPVQPVQHLTVEPIQPQRVQPIKPAQPLPMPIPKAKTPWQGIHVQTRPL